MHLVYLYHLVHLVQLVQIVHLVQLVHLVLVHLVQLVHIIVCAIFNFGEELVCFIFYFRLCCLIEAINQKRFAVSSLLSHHRFCSCVEESITIVDELAFQSC